MLTFTNVLHSIMNLFHGRYHFHPIRLELQKLVLDKIKLHWNVWDDVQEFQMKTGNQLHIPQQWKGSVCFPGIFSLVLADQNSPRSFFLALTCPMHLQLLVFTVLKKMLWWHTKAPMNHSSKYAENDSQAPGRTTFFLLLCQIFKLPLITLKTDLYWFQKDK